MEQLGSIFWSFVLIATVMVVAGQMAGLIKPKEK